MAFHLYLMAQPPGLPEAMISASPEVFFEHFLDVWLAEDEQLPDDVRAEYLRASAAAVPSIVADFRATAGIDVEHEQADRDAGRRLAMPVSVVQQDWGSALGYEATDVWRPWADDLVHRLTSAGHFMAETAPDEVIEDVRALLRR